MPRRVRPQSVRLRGGGLVPVLLRGNMTRARRLSAISSVRRIAARGRWFRSHGVEIAEHVDKADGLRVEFARPGDDENPTLFHPVNIRRRDTGCRSIGNHLLTKLIRLAGRHPLLVRPRLLPFRRRWLDCEVSCLPRRRQCHRRTSRHSHARCHWGTRIGHSCCPQHPPAGIQTLRPKPIRRLVNPICSVSVRHRPRRRSCVARPPTAESLRRPWCRCARSLLLAK